MSNEPGSVSPAEREEINRIYRSALEGGQPAGTVHVYLIGPDGKLIGSLHVAQAAITSRLQAMLESAIKTLHTRPGPMLGRAAPPSAPPAHPPDALVLHLTARYLDRQGNPERRVWDIPADRDRCVGGWHDFPSENWIVLEKARWAKLLPANDARVGLCWEIDREVASALLKYFYPQTENNDVARAKMDKLILGATVVSVEGGRARARLDGHLKMEHSFYHNADGKFVQTGLIGFIDFDPTTRCIVALRLITDQATYADSKFAVACRSVQ